MTGEGSRPGSGHSHNALQTIQRLNKHGKVDCKPTPIGPHSQKRELRKIPASSACHENLVESHRRPDVSADHYARCQQVVSQFVHQSDAHRLLAWTKVVSEETHEMVIRGRVENDVDVHIGFKRVTDAEIPGGSFGGSLVLQRKAELRSLPSDRHDSIVILRIPKVCEIILRADLRRRNPLSE